MNPVFEKFSAQTKKAWPFGIRLAQIVQELTLIKCPTQYKFKLQVLEKQGRLDQVLKFGVGSPEKSLLGQLIKNQKFEEALATVEYGGFTKIQNKVEILELLKRKTQGVGLNAGRGCPKLRARIKNLATAIFKETEPSLFDETFAEFTNTKHPISAVLKRSNRLTTEETEKEIAIDQTADNSPSELARLRRLVALNPVSP